MGAEHAGASLRAPCFECGVPRQELWRHSDRVRPAVWHVREGAGAGTASLRPRRRPVVLQSRPDRLRRVDLDATRHPQSAWDERKAPLTIRTAARLNSQWGNALAIAEHAAGIRQLESTIDIGTAVIRALIVVGMRRPVVAGKRGGPQQDRRVRWKRDDGERLRRCEENVRVLL